MNKNVVTASFIAAGLLLWLVSGFFVEKPERIPDTRSSSVLPQANQLTRVRVVQMNAEQRTLTRVLRGKTASKRAARVSAEISGRVVARPVERGDRVETGDLLCKLAIDEREAEVREATANLSRATIEYDGALKLKDRNLLSEIRIAQLAAELETAKAMLDRQTRRLSRTSIVAPFAGVVENLHMDVGDLAAIGAACATLIDLDPMLIAADVSEQDIGFITIGNSVSARTSTDQRLSGKVTFVGSQSNETTRTYPVEITVPNPDYSLRSGLTTVVSVATETVLAHRVSPALFTLDDAGVVGLRAVDRANRVVFHPVKVVEDAPDGAWVTGLPGVVRLITVGHEFVSSGQTVEVQDMSVAPATASRS